MTLENIIESLNKYIIEEREERKIDCKTFLILQKSLIPQPMFKAYKEYKYTIWFVKNRKSYKVLTIQQTARVLDDYEDAIHKQLNTMLCQSIFDWIGSKYYDEVIKGEYNGIPEDRNE
jgi:hypothetical protein